MGLKNTEKERTVYAKLYSKEPGTDAVNAFIGVSKKIGDKWEVVERYDTLNGRIIKIERDQFTYKDDEKQLMRIVFRDEDGQRIQLEASFTNSAYALMNCLAGADFSKPVKIVVFTGKNQKTNEPNPVILVYQDETRLQWTYTWGDEIPKVKTIKVGKKDVKDDSETVEFFCELLDSMSERQKQEAPDSGAPQEYVEPEPTREKPAKALSGPKRGETSRDEETHKQFSEKIHQSAKQHDSQEFFEGSDDLPF